MASIFGARALTQFRVVIEDVESNIRFLRLSTKLRPRLNDIIRWETVEPPESRLVQEFLAQKDAQPELIYRGMLTLIAGGFEELVRNLVEETVEVINDSAKSYRDLSEAIKIQNMIRTGKVLAAIGEPPDHLTIDVEALCRNIGSCVGDSESFRLNAAAFSFFIYSISATHLEEIFERFGIAINYDELCNVEPIRKVFGTTDARETSKEVKEYIRRFIQKRNRISHTGSGGVTVSDVDVGQFVDFFSAFSERLVTYLAQQLRKRYPSAK